MLGFIKDLPLLPTSPLKFLIFFTLALLWKLISLQFISGDRSKAWILCPFLMCCVVIQLDSCLYLLNLSLISVATAEKKSWHIYQFVWPFLLASSQIVLSLCESSNWMFQLILWKKPQCTAAHFVIGFWVDGNETHFPGCTMLVSLPLQGHFFVFIYWQCRHCYFFFSKIMEYVIKSFSSFLCVVKLLKKDPELHSKLCL